MSKDKNAKLLKEQADREARMKEMRAEMDRVGLIFERVKSGEATESELAEYKAFSDHFDNIPPGVVTG